MPGHVYALSGSPSDCQTRCADTPGCAHFTWWASTALCSLHEYRAERRVVAEAISGPSGCNDEAELAALRRSSFWGSEPPSPPPAGSEPRHDSFRMADGDGDW